MVTLGTLEWSVQVKNAQEAKAQAEEVEQKVQNASDAAEGADEKVGGLSERFSGLADRQKEAGAVTDKLNAKMGFLRTSIMGTIGTIAGLVSGLTLLKAIIVGGAIAAGIAALAVAFKENFGGLRDHVMNFVDFLKGAFQGAKDTVLAIWNSFMAGFGEGGGSLKQVESLFASVLDGIQKGLERFWSVAEPIWTGFWDIVIKVAGVVGQAFGTIVNWLSKLEGNTGILTEIVSWLTTIAAVAATVWAAIQVGIAVFGALSSAAGTVSAILGVVGTVLGALSAPVLAVIAVIALLAAAFYTNFGGIRDFVMDIVDGLVGYLQTVFGKWVKMAQKNIQKIVLVFDRHLGPLIKETKAAFNAIVSFLEPIMSFIVDIMRRYLSAVVPVWKSILNPIMNIVMGVFGMIYTIIAGTLDTIITVIRVVLNLITGDWKKAWSLVVGLVQRNFDRMVSLIESFVGIIGSAVKLVVNAILAPFKAMYNFIVGNSLIPDLLNGIASVFKGAVSMIKGAVGAVVGAITAPFKAIAGVAGGAFKAIGGLAGGAMDAAKGAISGAKSAVSSAAGAVAGAITDAFKGAKDAVAGIASSIGGMASDAVGAAQDAAGAAADAAGGAASAVGDAAGGAADAAGDVASGLGNAVGLDSGGIVGKTGFAKIHKGEAVVPADVTKEVMREGVDKGKGQQITIEVGGIEIGDQSLDLSKLTRREMQELADMLAERLGNEVSNSVS